MSRQEPLIAVESVDLARQALRKVRAAKLLSPEEFAALELAVKGELPKKSRFPEWQSVIASWIREYESATGGKPPRMTDPEANILKSTANRLRSAEETIKLIGAFWRWRSRQQEKFPSMASPQPTTFGFAKHLSSVKEFSAREDRQTKEAEKAKREREAAERRFHDRSDPIEHEPLVDGPTVEDIRRVRENLAGGMSRPYLETRR